ncbi:hypothetical protein H0A61_00027 [Koleobacter methoxysyntrophicus]|jgi:hypothetical protein|uniref:Uncharacterized protein n=1 Tax=Koleobacter methoxysyntrophicus TaxID=2751313 RepID=A0A8A0RGV9_9FIRM|nr:hypothetical protein [Koleobacter methoxysyntrophicus]QSQ07711.1 hypothetical protein H0A61_00027 [Koleobacter methoxysyntrophicus]
MRINLKIFKVFWAKINFSALMFLLYLAYSWLFKKTIGGGIAETFNLSLPLNRNKLAEKGVIDICDA